jgi:hypothetical protein
MVCCQNDDTRNNKNINSVFWITTTSSKEGTWYIKGLYWLKIVCFWKISYQGLFGTGKDFIIKNYIER